VSHHQDKRIVFEGVETKRKGKFEKAIITFLCKTEKAAYWISTTFNRIEKKQGGQRYGKTLCLSLLRRTYGIKRAKAKNITISVQCLVQLRLTLLLLT